MPRLEDLMLCYKLSKHLPWQYKFFPQEIGYNDAKLLYIDMCVVWQLSVFQIRLSDKLFAWVHTFTSFYAHKFSVQNLCSICTQLTIICVLITCWWMSVVFSLCTFYLLCSLHAQMIVLFCFKVQCPDLQQKMKKSLQNHPSNESCTKHMNSEMEAVD